MSCLGRGLLLPQHLPDCARTPTRTSTGVSRTDPGTQLSPVCRTQRELPLHTVGSPEATAGGAGDRGALKKGDLTTRAPFGMCGFPEFTLENRKAGSWCGPAWFLSLNREGQSWNDTWLHRETLADPPAA